MLPPYFIEGFTLLTLATWSGSNALATVVSEDDWTKITGPHGVAFIAVAAVIVLWTSRVLSERRSEKSQNDRHKELIAVNRENADDLKELQKQTTDALIRSASHQAESAAAMRTLSNSLSLLTIELQKGKSDA